MVNHETGRDRLLKVLKKQAIERPCWILYPGLHAGSLLGFDSFELLKNEDKLLEALLSTNRLYKPNGIPVMFDLQLEAEILGCELSWDSKTVPIVKTHPLETNKEPFPPIPTATQGRLPLVLNVTRKLKEQIGTETALYGLITGPLTLAFQLRGMLVFMDLYDDETYFKRLIKYCTEVCKQVANYHINAGVDVVGIVDPMISQISPKIFSEFLSPPLSTMFNDLRDKNMHSSFIVCGDASANIEEMAKTKPDCISVDSTIDISNIKHITEEYNIVISGNIPINNILTQGNQLDCQRYAINLIEEMGNHNFILAPGCDLPYNVPSANILGISQVIQDFRATKLFLLEHQLIKKVKPNKPLIDTSKITVELFSVGDIRNSDCEAIVQQATEFTQNQKVPLTVIRHNLSLKKGIETFKQHKLTNIPSILINGKICYEANSYHPSTIDRLLNKVLS